MKGGEAIGYQGRKKRKTTNALYLTDSQGLPLAMSTPVAGNHNDLFQVKERFTEIRQTLQNANISMKGLFLNADPGFDAEQFRLLCSQEEVIANIPRNKRRKQSDKDYPFDEKLYKERYTIERTNAWMDGFRSILNRFDTTIDSWMGVNFLAFIVLMDRRI